MDGGLSEVWRVIDLRERDLRIGCIKTCVRPFDRLRVTTGGTKWDNERPALIECRYREMAREKKKNCETNPFFWRMANTDLLEGQVVIMSDF
jgi:hypothetical protein